MTHILVGGIPLCESRILIKLNHPCQYPTRREAFDMMVRLERLFPKKDFILVRGACPTSFRPCPIQP